MKIRQATEEDFDEILDVTAISYGFDAKNNRERVKKSYDICFDEEFVVEVDGKITAKARNIPLIQNVRGKLIPMAGISNVATDPVSRRKGHSRKLMKYLVRKMYDDDLNVSTLYPFKDTFYAKFGYVNVNPATQLIINPSQLRKWKTLPEGYTIKRTNDVDSFDIYKKIHDEFFGNIHGGVVRPEKRWKEYGEQSRVKVAIVYNPNGKPEGLVRFTLRGFSSGFDWAQDGEINVHEFLYLTNKARIALLNHLYLYADQVVKILLPIYPETSEIYTWLENFFITEIKSQNIWMARVVDVKKTLQDMPTEAEVEISFKVTDPIINENNAVYQITGSKKKIIVKESKDKTAPLELTIEGLTALVYGMLSAEEVESFGWMKGGSEATNTILDNFFPRKIGYLNEGF
ncbi:MAG: GNAT family N-acetyltransferase [Candidatus Heimdallarchaeota archaeon]